MDFPHLLPEEQVGPRKWEMKEYLDVIVFSLQDFKFYCSPGSGNILFEPCEIVERWLYYRREQ